MRNFIKIFSLVLCVSFLSACASMPQGRLTKQDAELPLKAVVIQNNKDISVRVPQTSTAGQGGLLGALVSVAATEVSRQKRLPILNKIKPAYKSSGAQSLGNKDYTNVVSKANWIKASRKTVLNNVSMNSYRETAKYEAKANDVNAIVTIYNSHIFSETFKELFSYLTVNINDVADNTMGKTIYSLNLIEAFSPPELITDEKFADPAVWTANNGKLLKQAISHNNKSLEKQLKNYMKDPFLPE